MGAGTIPTGGERQFSVPPGAMLDLLPDEIAEPIRAGVRARAVAERCEASHTAAVLLDSAGHALYVSTAAAARLGRDVTVVDGALQAISVDGNRLLQTLLAEALRADVSPGEVLSRRIAGGDDSAGVTVSIVDFVDESPYQQLKAVLVLGEDSVAATSLLVNGVSALRS
jgi:hypothetical protein